MGSLEQKVLHYNDWPNSQGFDVHYEERSPVELAVQGEIPAYASGTLFRTGIGPRKLDTDNGTTYATRHWFDGLAQVHRFQIHRPSADHQSVRVTYNSRLTCDGVIERIRRTGQNEAYSFAAKYDLCTSYFQKLQSVFKAAPPYRNPDQVSMSITLSANFPGLNATGRRADQGLEKGRISSLCNRTDSSAFQMLDPQTLEPIGVARQSRLHPLLKGPSSAAHAKSDPETGDVYNFNLDFGWNGVYRVFKVSASTGDTSILATISATPSYLHSLFLTENYVILCVWNAFFSLGGTPIFYYKNLADAIAPYDESRPAVWYVIDRTPPEAGGQGLIATYESSHFFAFHAVNAYEEGPTEGGQLPDIIADVVAYDNIDSVKRFFLDNLMSDSPTATSFNDETYAHCRSTIRRFKLSSIPAEPTSERFRCTMVFSEARELSVELPVINPSKILSKHRFIYGVTETGNASFFDGLVKYDTETHQALQWHYHGQTAGEPIFVADPQGQDEDAGVLLSVVLDGIEGKSYLLVLDAKTMKEVGRAKVNGAVGFGFHGSHIADAKDEVALQF